LQDEEREILRIFEETGAILKGHFQLSSGLHSDIYIQCAKVLQYPKYCQVLSQKLVQKLEDPAEIDVVVSPAMGGIIIGFGVATEIGCRMIFAERKEDAMTLRRGFQITPGERALVVEDVITTGGSVKEVLELCRERGAEIKGVACLIDRNIEDTGLNPTFLLKMKAEAFPPSNCPLCAAGIQIDKPGSRGLY
jgi:orotate phosphoribosyltransferase